MSTRNSPDDDTLPVAAAAPDRDQARTQSEGPTQPPLGHPEIVESLERSLRVLMNSASHPRIAYDALRQAWFPLLSQSLRQVGGDGVEAWLSALFRPPGRLPADGYFEELVAALQRMRLARDVAHLEEESLKAIELVRRMGRSGPPRALVTRGLEQDLEDALDLETALGVAAATEDELRRRLGEVGGSLAAMRDRVASRPGREPAQTYSHFRRLKAEARLLDAELRRRAGGMIADDATPVV